MADLQADLQRSLLLLRTLLLKGAEVESAAVIRQTVEEVIPLLQRNLTFGVRVGAEAQALDPNKVQICRVNPVAYDNGQPCACPVATCNLWRGGLRPAGVPEVGHQTFPPSGTDGAGR